MADFPLTGCWMKKRMIIIWHGDGGGGTSQKFRKLLVNEQLDVRTYIPIVVVETL